MKNVLNVLTILLIGAILTSSGFAAAKSARVKAMSRSQQDESVSFVNSPARAQLPILMRKQLSADDPTPMNYNSPVLGRTLLDFPAKLQERNLRPYSGSLSGSYNVGSGGAYATISDAVASAVSNGVSGPVTFVLTDASYSENPIVVSAIPGASAVNTVTLTVGASVNAVVKFQLFKDLPWGFIFANAHYFTINGVGTGGSSLKFEIDETATAFPLHPREATIAFANVTDHITVENMTVTSAADSAAWSSVRDARHGIVFLNTSLSSAISDVTIQNCKFGRCFYGILSIAPNNGDDGTVFNGGATAGSIALCQATVQRIHILNNMFGTVLTGEQPCANAISVGGYSNGGNLIGGLNIEVGGNKAIGDQFNGNFDFVTGANPGVLIGTYTGFFEPLYLGGLFGATDMALHGAGAVGSDSSTFHDNVDSLYYITVSSLHGTSTVNANLAYCFSLRGGGATGYNNLVTHAHDNDGGRQTYLTRAEGCRWYHNTNWASGPGRRYFALRVRGGCTYENNIAYAAKIGTTNRVCALRYDGGTGSHNVIAKDPLVADGSGGTVLFRDGNGNLYWQLSDLQGGFGTDFSSTQQNPNLTATGDLHPTGTSSAESFGVPILGFTHNDFDNNVRSLTTPDAGAYEFSGTAHSGYVDAAALSIDAPSPAGTPFGAPAIPSATVQNESDGPATISVEFFVDSATVHVYDNTVSSGVMPAHSKKSLTFPSWTPLSNGPYTVTVTTTLGGDAVAANNSVTRDQAIVPLLSSFPQTFDFESGSQGWVGTGNWIIDNATDDFGNGQLDALGGPHGGAGQSWVTDNLSGTIGPNSTQGGYNNQTNHQLLSPFFSTMGVTKLYVNFFHSIRTEPRWDRSVFEYSLDTGKTWVPIGDLNDANGINWYSKNPYENADTNDGSCFDGATALSVKWPDAGGRNYPAWSSNGNCHGSDQATGPFGWVFVQIKLPAAAIHHPFVRFRYAAFADGSSGDDGWALDDVKFDSIPNNSTGSFSGIVYGDGNANGTKDGYESGLDGIKVRVTGAKTDSTVTAGGGLFTFTGLIAGAYTFSVDHAGGTSVTQPYGPNTYSALFGPGDVFTGQAFGLFGGAIHGDPYRDDNNNGHKDAGEPGVQGREIRAYRQSDLYAFKQALAKGDNTTLNSLKVASSLSDGSGNYFIEAKAGDYIIAEVLDPAYNNSQPGVADTTNVDNGDGTSTVHNVIGYYSAVHIDSLTPTPAGGNFGDFKYAKIQVFLTEDVNGNGVRDLPADASFPMPFGTNSVFVLYKNGVQVATQTLEGSGSQDYIIFDKLGVGNFSVKQTGVQSGWVQTLGATHVANVFRSGVLDTAYYLNFQTFCINGTKYNDLNGNGVKDSSEPGLAGWVIKVKGADTATAVTDANGNYSICGLSKSGRDTVYEVAQAGYVGTQPASGLYSFNVLTGQSHQNVNFGNFKKVTISGTTYRDRNGNGSMDPGDNGLSGWTVNGTNGAGVSVSDGSGNYSFPGLGPGTYVLSETGQVGYTQTQPATTWSVTVSSGTNVTRNFGNYQITDDATYRTWTATELAGANEAKPVKKPKIGKPITVAPNSGNLLQDLLTQPKVTMGPVIQVGISAQLVGGKEKGYLLPGKQGDAYATFNSKGAVHTGAARPLSFFNDGIKRILKRAKSLPSTKVNDILIADLLAFKINLAASAKSQTDPGLNLGNLTLCESGHAGLSGKTLSQISVYSDSIMTNWDDRGLPGTPAGMWTDLDTVIAKINAAFSTGLTSDTAIPNGGWTQPKLKWALSNKKASSTGFLCAPGPGIVGSSVPTNPNGFVPPPMPTVYALNQNYPNPFNPTTTISFDLPMSSIVTLKVYNMLGQEVTTLYNNEQIDMGTQEVEFDASMLTSGVYFYRVTAQAVNDDGQTTGQTFTKTMKMMLVK